MPVLTPVEAEMAIACVTIAWGILIETWYVSRWTIFFNIVPAIAFLAVFEDSSVIGFTIVFLLVSIVAISITGRQWLKQLIGAKTYGVFALSAGLVNAEIIQPDGWFGVFLIIGFFVFFCWGVVYLIKDQYG